MLGEILQSGADFKDSVIRALRQLDNELSKLRLIQGRGIRLQKTPSGTVVEAEKQVHGVSTGAASATETGYMKPFAVSYDRKTDKINVNTGFLNRNGEFLRVPAQSVMLNAGYICVATHLGNDGGWSNPEINIIPEPDEENYPIGYCEISGSGEAKSVKIFPFYVSVAIFIVVGDCEDKE